MTRYMILRFICIYILFNGRKLINCDLDPNNSQPISLLKLITDDGSGPRENDRSAYVMEYNVFSYHFSFKKQSMCKEVKYGDSSVWAHNSNEKYPSGLSIHLDLKQIFIQIENTAKVYEYDNNKWNLKYEKSLDEFPADGIQILTEDGNNDYETERSGISVNYYFNKTSKCKEIKFNNNTLWRHGNETQNKYPKRLYFNLFKKIALIDFRSFYLVLNYREGGSNLVSRTDIDKDETSKITIVTEDSKGISQNNDPTKFQLKKYDLVSRFIFNDESGLKEFKYGGNTVWNNTHDTNHGLPKSLCFHKDLRLIFLELGDLTNGYKCFEGNCQLITQIPHEGLSPSRLSIITENHGLRIVNMDPEHWVEKEYGFSTEYHFTNGAKCTELKYDNSTIWSINSNESENKTPTKLFFHLYTRMVLVVFNDFYLVYKYDGNQFKFVSRDTLSATEADFTFFQASRQMDSDNYDLVKYPYGYACVFKFKEGSLCNELKFKGKSVWKKKRISDPNPQVVYVNYDMKMLYLESNEFIIAYMYLNDEWVKIFTFPDETGQHTGNNPPGYENKSLRGKSGLKKHFQGKNSLIIVVCSVIIAILLILMFFLIFHFIK